MEDPEWGHRDGAQRIGENNNPGVLKKTRGLKFLAGAAGLEPATNGFGGHYSTIELHPCVKMPHGYFIKDRGGWQ